MSFNHSTLRSFITADGKLVLCNEPFFIHFGHSTQHLIGKTVAEVFSASDANEIFLAINQCKCHPEQTYTIETKKSNEKGCHFFQWMIYAEQRQNKVTGIHLIGRNIGTEKVA